MSYHVQIEMKRGAVSSWTTRTVFEDAADAIAKADAYRDNVIQYSRGTGRFRVVRRDVAVISGAEIVVYETQTAMASVGARTSGRRVSSKPRDTQKQKLYNAERVLRAYADPLPTVADMEKYVAKVLKRAPIVARYPQDLQPIDVCPGKWGQRRALAHGGDRISMPKWSRDTHIVLHEVAHVIASRVHGARNIAGHGWQYAKVYIDLVHFMMGREAAEALKISFAHHGVRYKAPRPKKRLTPSQKADLVARLQMGRERKLRFAA